jgi:hypothetical protein
MSSALAEAPAAPQAMDNRPLVNSFDVFDTLIARRCIEPTRIFETVERRLGLPGFARQRMQAEVALAGHDITLDSIYAELARRIGLGPASATALQAAELEVELENVIPIAANMAKLRDGDVLISDMYLSEPAIRALLAKAGMDKICGLIVSTAGKSTGTVWPAVQSRLRIACHTGDHPHSDIVSPARFGIATSHTTRAAPDLMETWLIDQGLRGIAEIIRETRLACPDADPLTDRLRWVQTHLNFPLLLLASLRLARQANRGGNSHLLFSSRDCNLWLPLYNLIAPRMGAPPGHYFYTNRQTRVHPSPNYLAYAAQALGATGMVVDLCGSGWSLAHLLRHLGQTSRDVFLLHHMPELPRYETIGPAPATCRMHAILAPSTEGLRNDVLEMCNYASHGTVIDVKTIGPAAVPVLADHAYPDDLAERVKTQREAFTGAIACLASRPAASPGELDDAAIDKIILSLYRVISAEPALPGIFGSAHSASDAAVMQSLEKAQVLF